MKSIADFVKPTTFTVKHYDKTVTIEIDHSDIDFNEVMEVFESLTIAMGFSKDSFRNWVKEAVLIIQKKMKKNCINLIRH